MNKTASQNRSSRAGQFIVAGRARDGIEILRQTTTPSSFTRQQADRVIDRIKDGRSGFTIERVPSAGRGDAK